MIVLKLVFAFVVWVGMLAFDGCADETPVPDDTFRVLVTQGDAAREAVVEIAATPSERQQGLMFRQELGEDAGMLFLFPVDSRGGFWMRNTYVPLDIAYISAAGEVQEIREGQPLNETSLTPAMPYRYVLEVNQGWFAKHGLGVGATVFLPEGLPEPR